MSDSSHVLADFQRFFQEQMQRQVSTEMLYRLWVAPIQMCAWDAESKTLDVQLKNHQQLNTVRQSYLKDIQRLAQHFFKVNQPIKIALSVRSSVLESVVSNEPGVAGGGESSRALAASASEESAHAAPGAVSANDDSHRFGTHAASEEPPKRRGRPRKNPEGYSEAVITKPTDLLLRPEHTFENFVSGDFNNFAVAVGHQVAANPGADQTNPLYIYGGTGLGKTHLMQAIGHKIYTQYPEKNICYITASEYLSRFTQVAVRGGSNYEAFRNYFTSFDVLLIDDIQNLQQKNATQVEFFHLYEFMLREKRQIVVASDCYPKDLSLGSGMMSRLVNRLGAGVVVEINPPGPEMRVAILEHEAKQKPEIRLTDDAAFFIAENVPYSIRELKGVWNQVLLWAEFNKAQEITIALVQDALKGHLRSYSAHVTTDQVIRMVAEHYRLTVPIILGKTRTADVVYARHVAMYLARLLTGQSYPNLAKAFNRQDHTTIIYSYNKVEKARETDTVLNRTLHILEQNIKG